MQEKGAPHLTRSAVVGQVSGALAIRRRSAWAHLPVCIVLAAHKNTRSPICTQSFAVRACTQLRRRRRRPRRDDNGGAQTEDKTKHVTPSSGRTSETCYVHRHHLPWLMVRAFLRTAWWPRAWRSVCLRLSERENDGLLLFAVLVAAGRFVTKWASRVA